MGTRIHYRLERRRKRDVSEGIPLIEFAAKNFIHPDTVRYWIQTHRVVGFKQAGRWYIQEDPGGRND